MAHDPVNSPDHYTYGGIETIDFIEAKGLDYHLGNVVKYISRAGAKDLAGRLEDLRKARWYLDRHIGILSAEGANGGNRGSDRGGDQRDADTLRCGHAACLYTSRDGIPCGQCREHCVLY